MKNTSAKKAKQTVVIGLDWWCPKCGKKNSLFNPVCAHCGRESKLAARIFSDYIVR